MNQTGPDIVSDALLLRQLREGSEKAFNAIFDKYWETAFSAACKRLDDHNAAKDIVQDIFTHIWLNRETLHINNLPAYFHVAVRNRVINFMARQKRTHAFFDVLNDIPESSEQADARLLWKEFFESYEVFVNSLPPKRQEIFRLRFQEGLSTRVISLKMGIERKTVQNQLGKAVDSLKVSLLRLLIFVLFLLLQ
jgi:RNA polymerase sigma-70 factor (ECF subfamily)